LSDIAKKNGVNPKAIFYALKRMKITRKKQLRYRDRTYAKTLYIAHNNFDELHALSRALAQLCGTQSPNYFYSKTNSNSSQITFILIEGCFN
jgi:hypothetical protein